jgi:3-oxoacyl-[acyl-carrier protein] reductase
VTDLPTDGTARWSDPSGPPRLDGQVAVITGASRGIGLAIATAFVDAGARVVLNARRAEALGEAVAGLGDAAVGVAGSVTEAGVAERACATAIERFGRLDLLVNGAGTNPQYGPLIEADLAAVDKVLETNLRAPLVWTQAAWRASLRDHGGAVLNVASIGGLQPAPRMGAYAISKAGLLQLTKALAYELGPAVRVNAVAPAVVRTRFSEALTADEEGVVAHYPLGRLGEPADVAQAALYLCSPAAAWVTGVTLVLDGGALSGHRYGR